MEYAFRHMHVAFGKKCPCSLRERRDALYWHDKCELNQENMGSRTEPVLEMQAAYAFRHMHFAFGNKCCCSLHKRGHALYWHDEAKMDQKKNGLNERTAVRDARGICISAYAFRHMHFALGKSAAAQCTSEEIQCTDTTNAKWINELNE